MGPLPGIWLHKEIRPWGARLLNGTGDGPPIQVPKQKNKIRPVFQPSYSGHRVEDGKRDNKQRPFPCERARDKSTGRNRHKPRLQGSRNWNPVASERDIAGRHEVEFTRPDERPQVCRLSKQEEQTALQAELLRSVVGRSGHTQRWWGTWEPPLCFGKAPHN